MNTCLMEHLENSTWNIEPSSLQLIILIVNQFIRVHTLFLDQWKNNCNRVSIPKIGDMIRSKGGFTFASLLDLNMGNYHIKLHVDAQKLCTIVCILVVGLN
jgi:hypothetical protein